MKPFFERLDTLPKGAILKRVQYQETQRADFYNLAFGDVNSATNTIDDKVVSNNNDIEKILATVAKTIPIFMKKHPYAYIYAKGSTVTRTRLYRISISKNLETISKQFTVYGMIEGFGWVLYERNNNYSAFLIKNR